MPGLLKPIIIIKENVDLTTSLYEKLFASLEQLDGCNLPIICTVNDQNDPVKKRYLDLTSRPLQETDLVIGAKVMDIAESQMKTAIQRCVDMVLTPKKPISSDPSSRTIRDAVTQDPKLNLAVIDLDEEYALREAHSALKVN